MADPGKGLSREPGASDLEGLGVFYLGRRLEPGAAPAAPTGNAQAPPFLYDAKDLTTHAVIVGMTGSGKTGLGVTLLEEAALDGVPALVIDPKGDLANLCLAFPDLAPASFAPWIDPEEAARAGHTADEHARAVAERWRHGLAAWGQGPERVARFRDAAERAVYTPGSAAGRPLRVLGSLAAPPPALRGDADALRERVQTSVSGLLSLLGVDADPIRSREHILLARLVEGAWAKGEDLDLPGLIRALQRPPFDRVGVFDLEAFFPADDRMALAMTLNNLLASPGFAAWREGEPLDVTRLLHTPEGKPRLAILSIAHLGEAERMFFVTLLLNEVVAWMRSRPGTASLRALLYMDEVMGYLPPTANPPSKTPMLTLLKQARAYGLGVVLATQNPVDLDYKALSNAGTWFLGRLQTERDKARVLEGLEGAAAPASGRFDRAGSERLLAGLRSRVFLMHSAHEDEPVLFETRWALSYLRGPLTREQIRGLEASQPEDAGAARREDAAASRADDAAAGKADASAAGKADASAAGKPDEPGAARAGGHGDPPAATAAGARPVLPPGVEERFEALAAPRDPGAGVLYRPFARAVAHLHYVRASVDLDHWRRVELLAPFGADGAPDWGRAAVRTPGAFALADGPAPGARFAPLPAGALAQEGLERHARDLASWLHREMPHRVLQSRAPRMHSRPDEDEGAFRVRLREALHEARDREVEKLRGRYAPRVARLEERIRRAAARVEREEDQARGATLQAAISVGASVLGALLGRKLTSARSVGRATTAARGMGRAADQREDVARAEAELAELERKRAALEAELEERLAALQEAHREEALELKTLPVAPRKSDLAPEGFALVWRPASEGTAGAGAPLRAATSGAA